MIYDTKEINNYKKALTDNIIVNFNKLEIGEVNSISLLNQKELRKKYPYFNKGYLCEVTMNSIRGSTVLSNIGPVIPIKLTFMGYVESTINTEVKEYGINNALVEISVKVKVSNLISMPISTRIHQSTIKNVISLELVKGDIPDYYLKEFK